MPCDSPRIPSTRMRLSSGSGCVLGPHRSLRRWFQPCFSGCRKRAETRIRTRSICTGVPPDADHHALTVPASPDQPSSIPACWAMHALLVLQLPPAVEHQQRISRWLSRRPERPIVYPLEVRRVLRDLELEMTR